MELLKKFRELRKVQSAYGYMMNVVGWDSNTEAPRNSFGRRAEMMGVISGEMFKLSTSQEYQDTVYGLYNSLDKLDHFTQMEIKKAKKSLDKQVKIPEKDFVEYNKLINLSQKVWEDAKENDDWSSFQGNLEKIVEYNKKFITYYDIDDHPYNVLLDEFEEGMSMEEYDKFFSTLKSDLVPFVKEVLNSGKRVNDDIINDFYSKENQKIFSEYITDVLAFDLDSGLMKESVHPFTWNTHPGDVRFTTRYLENFVFSSIFASIHELGHATYEQQVDPKWNDTLLSGGTSMGIHESQSRFYENVVGRSKEFWAVHYPKFKELFPKQLEGVELDEFHLAINKVEASLIRVEADELTYSLHIMIRYEIERMLFSNEVETKDLPKLWNEKMVEYLGIKPNNDADGVLQDVHWSAGLMGYFPTYALGSAYAAQFYYTMIKEINLDEIILQNNIKDLNRWLKDKIHQFGGSKTPKELLFDVTGEDFNPQYYVRYLKEKYSKLYL
jgi:carboxypeptidase Taq